MASSPNDVFSTFNRNGEMAERLRAYDWAASKLGAPDQWPETLRLILAVCFDSPFPIAVWWGKDLIQFYNDGYRPILGAVKHPQAFGFPARQSWPEIWPTIGPMVDQVMEQGLAVKGDDMPLWLDRNGYPELCYFTFSYSPIRNLSGEIVGMFTTAVETTSRVFAERRQAFQLTLADRLRELVTPEEIIRAATELVGKYLNVARAFYAEIDDASSTFHIPAKWIKSADLKDLPSAGKIDDLSPALLASLRRGQPFVFGNVRTDEHMRGFAEAYTVLDIASLVVVPLVKAGKLRAAFNVGDSAPRRWAPDDIAIVQDVAERTWDAIERARAELALREADRLKDEFLAMLGHELRNPLAPISAAAELLVLGRPDEARLKKTSGVIARQVAHMTKLVDDLLDVSRVTRGLVELETVDLDAHLVVSDALEQVKPMLQARRHHLTVEQPDEAVSVRGDHKRLVQVLTNLLSNAVKYTPEGGAIVLKTELAPQQLVFSVRDNGIGMDLDLQNRAFDLFVQAKRTADRSQGGLGIGLALVRSIVALHGGAVAVKSAGAGQGSEFTVSLPMPAPSNRHGDADLAERAGDTARKPLRILIVDDNHDAATMLALVFESAGHEVLVEHHPTAALDRARTAMPDVCLLDIGLPDMDGNELARQLRAIPQIEDSVLIAVTGYGQQSDRATALAAGFDYHFMKPVDTGNLAKLFAQIDSDKQPASKA